MSNEFNLAELGSLAELVEQKIKAEASSVFSRLASAGIGEFATLFSEGLAIANKWEALHIKVQAQAAASAPAPEPSAPASEPPAEASAPEPSEQDTVALPAVPAPEDVPAQ